MHHTLSPISSNKNKLQRRVYCMVNIWNHSLYQLKMSEWALVLGWQQHRLSIIATAIALTLYLTHHHKCSVCNLQQTKTKCITKRRFTSQFVSLLINLIYCQPMLWYSNRLFSLFAHFLIPFSFQSMTVNAFIWVFVCVCICVNMYLQMFTSQY